MDKIQELYNTVSIFKKQEIVTVKEYKDMVAQTIYLHWKLQNKYNTELEQQMTEIATMLIESATSFEKDKKLMRNGSIRIFSKSIYTYVQIF